MYVKISQEEVHGGFSGFLLRINGNKKDSKLVLYS